MKKPLIPVVALIILAIASCSKPSPTINSSQAAPIDSLGEKNKELVKKYMDALLIGNTTTMAEYLADGYMGHGPSMKDSVAKQQNLDNWKKSWEEQFKTITYDEVAVLTPSVKPETKSRAVGDWVLTWGIISVDYKNGMPSVKFNLHATYRVTNGKIDRSYVYYNVADILTQQGFTFVPHAKKGAKK